MPAPYDMHRFVTDELKVPIDGVRGLQFHPVDMCVFLKLELESRFLQTIRNAYGPVTFRYADGQDIQISLSDASVCTKHVKISCLPFELSDSRIKAALEVFGKVREVIRDTWHDQYFGNIENGTRTVIMELKDDIPSRIVVDGMPGYVSYPGQPKTCHYCQAAGHLIVDCPKRKPSQNTGSSSSQNTGSSASGETRTLADVVQNKPPSNEALTYTNLNLVVKTTAPKEPLNVDLLDDSASQSDLSQQNLQKPREYTSPEQMNRCDEIDSVSSGSEDSQSPLKHKSKRSRRHHRKSSSSSGDRKRSPLNKPNKQASQ